MLNYGFAKGRIVRHKATGMFGRIGKCNKRAVLVNYEGYEGCMTLQVVYKREEMVETFRTFTQFTRMDRDALRRHAEAVRAAVGASVPIKPKAPQNAPQRKSQSDTAQPRQYTLF